MSIAGRGNSLALRMGAIVLALFVASGPCCCSPGPGGGSGTVRSDHRRTRWSSAGCGRNYQERGTGVVER